MRKVLALLAVLVLSSCSTMIDNLYDERAREECDQGGRDRSGCYDRVEQDRRERDRQP